MTNGKQDIGLVILGAGTSFGSWSAWNSSLFTVDTFVSDERKLQSAYTAMKYGLATSILMGLGIYWVYGEKGKAAAISAAGTGGLLYYVYDKKLKESSQLQGVYAQRERQAQPRTQKLATPHQRELYYRQLAIRQQKENNVNKLDKLAAIDLLGHALWFV